jgi:PadR family transcriptional regulator, regulatory protein PadR
MVEKALIAASSKPIILSILLRGEDYGYRIIQRVKEVSGGELEWSEKMLYPVLHRLEKEEMVVSRWRISDEKRLRRYYEITAKGRKQLEKERSQWRSVTRALSKLWPASVSLD